MRFQLVATLAAVATLLVTAAPLESDWSYNDLYQYVVTRGGPDHPVAEAIVRHILALFNSFLDMSAKIAGISAIKTTSNLGTRCWSIVTPRAPLPNGGRPRRGPGPFLIMGGVRVSYNIFGAISSRMHVISLWLTLATGWSECTRWGFLVSLRKHAHPCIRIPQIVGVEWLVTPIYQGEARCALSKRT